MSHAPLRPATLAALLAIAGAGPAQASPVPAADAALPSPATLIVDPSLPPARAAAMVLAARRYDGFWSSGDAALMRQALAGDFTDRTLPPGRPQGLAGPLAASQAFRAAIPDLRVEIVQMLVTGDRVVSHMRFTGHFTGQMQGVRGSGQPVDFIATDIYRVRDGKIAENWHLEDNLTLMRQIGLVKP